MHCKLKWIHQVSNTCVLSGAVLQSSQSWRATRGKLINCHCVLGSEQLQNTGDLRSTMYLNAPIVICVLSMLLRLHFLSFNMIKRRARFSLLSLMAGLYSSEWVDEWFVHCLFSQSLLILNISYIEIVPNLTLHFFGVPAMHLPNVKWIGEVF